MSREARIGEAASWAAGGACKVCLRLTRDVKEGIFDSPTSFQQSGSELFCVFTVSCCVDKAEHVKFDLQSTRDVKERFFDSPASSQQSGS